MRILLVAAAFPYPPVRGYQVRAYHQIRLLSRRHEITLISYADKRIPQEMYDHLARMCRHVVIVPRNPALAMLNLTRAPLSTYPLQTLMYWSRHMRRAVRREIDRGSYDLAHTQLVHMAPFLENARDVPRVIDLIDALSMNMQRRYRVDRVPLKWAAYWEWQRLARYERKICEKYDQITVVSPVDQNAIGRFDNLHVNSNGVELGSFERLPIKTEENVLIFTGNMFYFPNVDAVCHFVRELFPIIKSQVPGVRLNIVGANPAKSIQRLTRDPAIKVTEWVPDIGRYLGTATVAICPMRAGSGMQFKVIEAMAAGTPVVATPFGLGGLEVVHGKNILVGKDPSEFASHVVRLLRDKTLRDYLAGNAIQLVRERYTWESIVASLEEVYEKALCRRPRCGSPLRVQCGN